MSEGAQSGPEWQPHTENNPIAEPVAVPRRFSLGRLARALPLVLLFLTLGACLYRYAAYDRTLLQYPYDWDEDEGLPVYFAQRLLKHQPIYVDFNELPMVSSVYPPVFPAAISLLLPRLGATLLAGRLISLGAVIGTVLLVIATVKQETGRWGPGLIAAALALGSPYVTIFSPLSRHDSLAIFLVFAGLFLVRQWPRYRATLPVGLVLLLLACYTKLQVAFLVPAAFWHLWSCGRRVGVVSLIAFAAGGLGVLAWLSAWSNGHYWPSTVTAQATDYAVTFLHDRTRGFLEQHAVLMSATLGLLVYQLIRRALDVWGAAMLTSSLIILLTGKTGAQINYFMPTIVAATICTGIGIGYIASRMPQVWEAGAGSAVMVVLSLQGAIFLLYPVPQPTTADRQAGDKILELIRGTKGDVLTERRQTFSLLAGREPQLDATAVIMAYQVGRENVSGGDMVYGTWRPKPGGEVLWDPAELITALNERRFPMIVLTPEFFRPEVLSAITANYRKLFPERITMGNWHGYNRYFVMVPR